MNSVLKVLENCCYCPSQLHYNAEQGYCFSLYQEKSCMTCKKTLFSSQDFPACSMFYLALSSKIVEIYLVWDLMEVMEQKVKALTKFHLEKVLTKYMFVQCCSGIFWCGLKSYRVRASSELLMRWLGRCV